MKRLFSLIGDKDNILKISTGVYFIFMENNNQWQEKAWKKSCTQFWSLQINCEFKTHLDKQYWKLDESWAEN